MAFGKHALKVITVFVVLFLAGLILKMLGLFNGNSVENFAVIPGYSQTMSDTDFKNLVNKYTKGNNGVLKNIPSDILNSLSDNHKKILEELSNWIF